MTNEQWEQLLNTVKGENSQNPVTAFIADSPWIPGWAGVSNLQFYSSEEIWFQVNKKMVETFPNTTFIPGFWSEFGMCTEPSAFGAKLIWNEYSLPHADKIIADVSDVSKLISPNPKTDGLLPFIVQRLLNYQKPMQELGHEVKFAIARGPLNIASFLMGTTELMMGFMMDPENSNRLLETITQFTINWIEYQKEIFPSIEGIMLLDDIVGFVGDDECKEYAVPYIKRIFNAFDSKLNLFHNDAPGLVSSPYLKEMGVDLFNFSFEHSLKEIRELAGPDVALLGNIAPRDILAQGTPQEVKTETIKMVKEFGNNNRMVWSCGGGLPQDVTTTNLNTFIDTVNEEVPKLKSSQEPV
jgi:uroporphyrinogen decarboxylase